MSDRPNRKSIRLHGYDYAGPGTIFFTYCTADRFDFFGSVIDGVMHENEVGDIAWAEWRKTLEIRKEVIAHAFVVMPNHVHVIIIFAPDSNSFIQTPSDF